MAAFCLDDFLLTEKIVPFSLLPDISGQIPFWGGMLQLQVLNWFPSVLVASSLKNACTVRGWKEELPWQRTC